MGTRFRKVDLYDYPEYYDIIFDEGSEEEADFVEAVWEAFGRKRRRGLRVLEPACGTGRLAIELARRGHRVCGFDASAAMLAYAKKRARAGGIRVSLSEDRMEAFSLSAPQVDLVVSLISSFKYLLTESQAQAHLQLVGEALAPGGLCLLGLHLTDYERDHAVHERWVAHRAGVKVVCNTRTWPADRRRRRERVRSRLTVDDGGEDAAPRRHESEWEFRTYNAAQLRRTLSRIDGLEIVAAYDFGYDLRAPRALDDSQEDIVLVLRQREGRS